jgi:hypothetical protein
MLVFIVRPDTKAAAVAAYGIEPIPTLALIAIVSAVVCAVARPQRGFLAFGGVLAAVLLIVSFVINPILNDERSSKSFVAHLEKVADPKFDLGLVAFKEQYVLNARRSIVHFGHARWREAEQEMADAAAWMSEQPGRQLVINDVARATCFMGAPVVELGEANRSAWYLVSSGANPVCIARGKPGAAHYYLPPGTRASN